MGKSMSPVGKDDKIRTPEFLAYSIVSHFNPTGRLCDPCMGDGAFYNALRHQPGQNSTSWYEIDRGRDYFAYSLSVDWTVTNPPWGKQFRPILLKAMATSQNVVFLCNLNVWFTKCRMREISEAGFGMVEALLCPTPTKPWPQTGFQLGAMWIRKGWAGSLTFSHLKGVK